jgi:hypothetical protein
MSENNSSGEDETNTINNLKKIKREKKGVSDEVKLIRGKNAKKAQEAKKSKFEERQKLKKVENNLKNIFDDDDDDEPVIIMKKKERGASPPHEKSDKKQIEGGKIERSDTINNNDLLNIISKMSNRVDKLYTMKKMKNNQPKKEIQPVIINDNNKANSLLESIRNKMINQY